MAHPVHLMIPFASSLEGGCQAAIGQLDLPHLQTFLKSATLQSRLHGDEFDFIPPHEIGHLSDQIIVTPCHWEVGIDHIRMDNPSDLQLTDAQSRLFLKALQPFFLEDGMALEYASPLCWRVHLNAGSGLLGTTDLQLASLDRVIGRHVDAWQPPLPQGRMLRRLQNEMQMLLYTHPINAQREAQGLPTVNSFWVSYAPLHTLQSISPSEVAFARDTDMLLRDSALQSDWVTWSRSWSKLDARLGECMHGLFNLQHNAPPDPLLQITLCGERHAATYALPPSMSRLQRLRRIFQPQPRIADVLTAL